MPAKAKVKGYYTPKGGSTTLLQVEQPACRVLGTPRPHFSHAGRLPGLRDLLTLRVGSG